jgi:hypothetical protein
MSIFKVGDRVYHIEYGWGVIEEVINSSVKINNGHKEGIYWFNTKLLSFTEYTLQGFSQERRIELPIVGELCLVRDDESIHWRVREFAFEHNGTFYVKEPCGSTDSYIYMKRIKILD